MDGCSGTDLFMVSTRNWNNCLYITWTIESRHLIELHRLRGTLILYSSNDLCEIHRKAMFLNNENTFQVTYDINETSARVLNCRLVNACFNSSELSLSSFAAVFKGASFDITACWQTSSSNSKLQRCKIAARTLYTESFALSTKPMLVKDWSKSSKLYWEGRCDSPPFKTLIDTKIVLFIRMEDVCSVWLLKKIVEVFTWKCWSFRPKLFFNLIGDWKTSI